MSRQILILYMLLTALVWGEPGDQPVTLRLASNLLQEQGFREAAVEFRRLALQTEDSAASGAYWWSAGYAYLQDGQRDLTLQMLDRAEAVDMDITGPADVLRLELAVHERAWQEAVFYAESLVQHSEEEKMRNYAARQLAAAQLARREWQAAETAAKMDAEALQMVRAYERHPHKRPWLGGVLGMIPGFGHFYSGEWANGFRAMILNGLFIYAMVDTADEEQWGAFTAATFFELTWYSGSIYGGIDAAHRYNRKVLDEAVMELRRGTEPEPNWDALPMLQLNFGW